MPTKGQLLEILKRHKREKCPPLSKLRKAELQALVERFGLSETQESKRVRMPALRETKRRPAIKAVKPLSEPSKKFSSRASVTPAVKPLKAESKKFSSSVKLPAATKPKSKVQIAYDKRIRVMNRRLKEMNSKVLRSMSATEKKKYISAISKMDLDGVEATIREKFEKIKFKSSFKMSRGEVAASRLFRVNKL